jgi:hypothetical protein
MEITPINVYFTTYVNVAAFGIEYDNSIFPTSSSPFPFQWLWSRLDDVSLLASHGVGW